MSGGVGAALGEVMDKAGDLPDAGEVVQSVLFDELDEADTGRLDAPSPLSAAFAPAKASPGRPKGSRNRRTNAVAAWLLSQHRHPLQVMAEAYSMAPADLAQRIGLRHAVKVTKDGEGNETEVVLDHYDNATLLEIVKLQLRMAEAVAPYVAQRMPLAVDAKVRASVQVAFEGVSFPARGPVAGELEQVEGEVLSVTLGAKSDGQSRTDD